MTRAILHVDLDAFYASVEQRDDPSLRGKPVIVGGHERRGVVLAASYEVRKFGVRSAMPMVEALRLAPNAIVIRPHMNRYAEDSRRFFEVLHRWSPLVEGLSLDEAFLDATGEERLFGGARAIAEKIRASVRDELRLVASVGIAPCKFVAKIASDVAKPDGLLEIAPEGVQTFLHPLPVWRLWGVGRVTEAKLARLGLKTIGDVARAGVAQLKPTVGAHSAQHLVSLANGIDDRVVVANRGAISIGHEDTFDRDLYERGEIALHLLDQADRVCARVRAHGLRARTVSIKIKYADHRILSRRSTLPDPTSDGRLVGEKAKELLARVPDVETRGVRLSGVHVSGLNAADERRQLELGETARERGEALGAALDRISDRFGDGTVKRAVHLPHAGRRS